MRVKIREELDVRAPVNLKKLSALGKIKAGLSTMWQNTEIYQKALNKNMEAANIAILQKDDHLKNLILGQLYLELNDNKTLSEKDARCSTVILAIDYHYKKSLQRILSHKEFLQYQIELVDENPDIRKAFCDMPILIKFSLKFVGGDKVAKD